MKRKLLDIARRLLILLLVVWTVVSLVTILIELVPGDPATAILGDQATPEALAQRLEAQTQLWAEVIAAAGVTAQ